jgi:hypothetical protein
MTEQRRTLLVPIDLHGVEPRSLETLVGIAQRLDLALLALFLEDLRLQQVADLPFTTEIVLSSGRERGLQPLELQRRHIRMAEATRLALDRLASRQRVELRFEQAAGQRWHNALQRDGGLDVFFAPRPRLSRQRVGADRGQAQSRLGLVLTGSATDRHALELASELLRARLMDRLCLLCEHPPAPAFPGLERQVRIQSGSSLDADALCALVRHSPYELLLLPAAAVAAIPPEQLDQALDNAAGQVLIAR